MRRPRRSYAVAVLTVALDVGSTSAPKYRTRVARTRRQPAGPGRVRMRWCLPSRKVSRTSRARLSTMPTTTDDLVLVPAPLRALNVHRPWSARRLPLTQLLLVVGRARGGGVGSPFPQRRGPPLMRLRWAVIVQCPPAASPPPMILLG